MKIVGRYTYNTLKILNSQAYNINYHKWSLCVIKFKNGDGEENYGSLVR